MDTTESSFIITNSAFTNSSAKRDGGVMYTSKSSLNITDSTLTNNCAIFCGVMDTTESSFIITSCAFTNSSARRDGGVIDTSKSSFHITDSAFTNSSAVFGGVIFTTESLFNITSSVFTNSSARLGGGVIYTGNSSFNIMESTFNYSSADEGGVAYTTYSSLSISISRFAVNSAQVGGVIDATSGSSLMIVGSTFHANKAYRYGGIMFTIECSTHITESTFDNNFGSLYIFNSNLTISGRSSGFEHCSEPLKTPMVLIQTLQEGGAITSFRGTLTFTGVSELSNNQARKGGAILATESKIMIDGEVTIANNTATHSSGGGISLHQSNLIIKEKCTIFGNNALRGGGIHITSSTVTVHEPGTLKFINNKAENGSGFYLDANPKVYILKYSSSDHNLLLFQGNHASYGGAVYIADDVNAGACSHDNECFIQILAIYQSMIAIPEIPVRNIFLSGNTASQLGPNIFGGLLDRCMPSPFAEVYLGPKTYYNGFSYLDNITQTMPLSLLDSTSSLPVRICFCNNESEPHCYYQPPIINVKKGETFTMLLIAVDQINRSVNANIISSLSSQEGGFGEGQQSQSVNRNCSKLTFNVFSPYKSETIQLYPNGPCGNAALSSRYLHIKFIDCSCPIGFEPLSSEAECQCICDSKLSSYITTCNATAETILRENTKLWITYVNDTDPPGYVIHPNCPFDYCQPPTTDVSVNLNLPAGPDAQCAYHRQGVLCGGCEEHLSLSLGSSLCLPCHKHWPIVLVVILLAAIVAGMLLVTALLVLNMTVTVGLINGFIFYANIVAANRAIFFPSSEPSFPTVFVAWLNLDIGIDVCFIDGLDAYTKTWLQLVFPVYMFSLVIIVITISEFSPTFASLIGKRDPVATLATLILLSYAKLLSVSITALSSAVLDYPDGSHETVWLLDGNVKYHDGKHIVLVFVAILIIFVGVPYTLLLFLWQWLVRLPEWSCFKWTRNTKLNAFIYAHHVPYNTKYRYWTGLLLLVRVVLFITGAVAESYTDKPQTALLTSSIFIGGLLFFNRITGIRVYKNSIVDIVETVLYLNLLFLSVFSLYDFKTDVRKQTAVAYISSIITFILLIGVIIYHIYLLVRKNKPRADLEEMNAYLLAPVQPSNTKACSATHSVFEITIPHDHSPPQEVDIEVISVD